MKKNILILICLVSILSLTFAEDLGSFSSYSKTRKAINIKSSNGNVLFRHYSPNIFRVQYAKEGEDFFLDDHYEMVNNHSQKGSFQVGNKPNRLILKSKNARIIIDKSDLSFDLERNEENLLLDGNFRWNRGELETHFKLDENEHFSGLGHKSFGQVESLDLKGKRTHTNYGAGYKDDYGAQAPLVVPFFMSSKSYGIFLNSTFENQFNFGENGNYAFSIDTKGYEGRMDYFIILGRDLKDVLGNYIKLTGNPRLPQKSMFGLHLSDKGNPDNKGAEWWRKRVSKHRNAGYPLDHVIIDNRWRAGSGDWSGSRFEWSPKRYPKPKKFNDWLNKQGLTMSVDLNRNICNDSWGWKKSYNLENTDSIRNHPNSAPDYSNPEVRNWVWELFWRKTLSPELDYPGDGLWIDEVDDLHKIPMHTKCANGRSWAENQNYYLFLVAEAIGQEGWDNKNNNQPPGLKNDKRPYIWMRGNTAGAQRYATHWTGDIKPDYKWMRRTIRGMQSSGLSGFPYFNHDAGGFRSPGPDDDMYLQWSLAFGSFSPIWRPHGPGDNKRWPLKRDKQCQKYAKKYSTIRYQLMPYIYTTAHQAYSSGLPMARPMMLNYPEKEKAWQYDLQYFWGENMLVRPVCSAQDTTLNIWLPEENDWYYYWNDQKFDGGQVKEHQCKVGELPIFVKSGAIIPERKYAKSTFWLKEDFLRLHIYAGDDGEFELIEDDGVTEKYRDQNQVRKTKINYYDNESKLVIEPAQGNYKGAPKRRKYVIQFHGNVQPNNFKINGNDIKEINDITQHDKDNAFLIDENSDLIILTKNYSVKDRIIVNLK